MAAAAPTRRAPGRLALPAAAVLTVAAVRGLDDDLVLELPFVAALTALAAIDLEHRLLPNRIVYPLAAWGLGATLLVERDDLPPEIDEVILSLNYQPRRIEEVFGEASFLADRLAQGR